MHNFCDNCAGDFQDIVLACEIWSEKVHLCSFLCMQQLERVWAPVSMQGRSQGVRRESTHTRPLAYYTEGKSALDVIMSANSKHVWSLDTPWYPSMFDALAVFSVSLAVFFAYIFTLYTMLDAF